MGASKCIKNVLETKIMITEGTILMITSIWNNYYDTASYEEITEKLDTTGNPVYLSPRNIELREVSGGRDYVIEKEGTATKYTKEYQIPFIVNPNDKINGRLVINTEASKDVFGNFHFCIAKVE